MIKAALLYNITIYKIISILTWSCGHKPILHVINLNTFAIRNNQFIIICVPNFIPGTYSS